MFGIGGTELVLILLFAFLIVGPEKLPQFARTLGKGIAKFREAQNEMNEVIETETEAIKSAVDAGVREGNSSTTKTKPVKVVHANEAGTTSSAASKAAEAPSADSQASATGVRQTTESFTERKARYERERAAKLEAQKAAEAEAAKADAQTKEGE